MIVGGLACRPERNGLHEKRPLGARRGPEGVSARCLLRADDLVDRGVMRKGDRVPDRDEFGVVECGDKVLG